MSEADEGTEYLSVLRSDRQASPGSILCLSPRSSMVSPLYKGCLYNINVDDGRSCSAATFDIEKDHIPAFPIDDHATEQQDQMAADLSRSH